MIQHMKTGTFISQINMDLGCLIIPVNSSYTDSILFLLYTLGDALMILQVTIIRRRINQYVVVLSGIRLWIETGVSLVKIVLIAYY